MGRSKGRKNPEQGRGSLFFRHFYFFGQGVTQKGGKAGNYNPWFRPSYAGQGVFLGSSPAKKKQTTWNRQTRLCHPRLRASQRSPLRLRCPPSPLHTEASWIPLGRLGNRTSVINRSVKYFLPLTRLQEVSQFHYALFYYYHIYILIFIVVFC